MKVGIAGASGFIGRNIIHRLEGRFQIKGFSRGKRESSPTIEWVETDLFSYQSTCQALEDVDIAIYLVHSMLPSSKLFQGTFQDTDLFLAHNFSNACQKNNVKHIIYLGGLVPVSGASKHLSSRLEVEEVFQSSGIPVTILRAGMIVGKGGSSFEMLKNLVINLPVMVLPKWTQSHTQAIYVDDMVNVFEAIVEQPRRFKNEIIDVVNGEKLTYEQLIAQTAKYLNKKFLRVKIPVNYTAFSKLWVKIFGEADYELVSPLIDSLSCDLPTPPISQKIEALITQRSYLDMIRGIPKEKIKRRSVPKRTKINNVRSIQRLPNPLKMSQIEISDEYFHWLPKFFRFFLLAKQQQRTIKFMFFGIPLPLLILNKMESPEELDRVKFHIVGGLLSKSRDTGWLEFRLVANGKYTLTSINEFIPSLPWFVYKYSQALVHAFVMRSFGKHLNTIDKK